VSVSNCCISQGSATTYLRCGGNYYIRFVGNFFLFIAVQKIFEIDKDLTKLSPKFGTQFFLGDSVHIITSVQHPCSSQIRARVSAMSASVADENHLYP